MPEPAAWRYQKLIKPMFDDVAFEGILRGRVITCADDEVIEDGFVELRGGNLTRVGRASDLGSAAEGSVVIDLSRRSCPA